MMSGTSGDGIDAVVAQVPPGDPARATVLVHYHADFEPEFRARVLSLPAASPSELALMHVELGRRLGAAARTALLQAGLQPADIGVVSSPGLTVVHLPPGPQGEGATLTLGDGDVIAAVSGCDVLSDLRAADRAAGGHGAPLVPFADALLLRPRALAAGGPVAALNLGGIGNLTIVPQAGDPLAFDTGPANMLLDGALARATRGARTFDEDGRLGRAGRVHAQQLAQWLAEDDFLKQPPPRSTGRERYGAQWLANHAAALDALSLEDLCATLAAYTVESVALALERFVPERPQQLIVSGGGACNACLMAGLAARLPGISVQDSAAALGVPVLAREALAFALIGDASLRGLPGNVPSVTGARRACVLGKLSRAPR
ncbi:MAG: anhydro-N-acetylmuramic acid kinase [Planctomycetota bacterium]